MNTVNRGGHVQCRPGFDSLYNLPEGKLQGFRLFTPTGGAPQQLAVVDGALYVSTSPFKTYKQIEGIEFSPYAPYVYWEQAVQSVELNEDGSLTLIVPKTVLVIQDGKSPPAFWDGAEGEHTRDIPLGTHMKWSGDRLWVARENRVFKSDIGNPFGYEEGLYIGNIGSFVLPGDVTGMGELPSTDQPVLLVFSSNTTTRFLSGVRNASLWSSISNFQQVILPTIGCVAHRSIVAGNGVLWWFSQYGFINLNAALSINVDSAIQYLDHGMAYSKGRLAPDLSGIASAAFENYVLVSVPYTDIYNRHTWCRDESTRSWNSYWTGIRPVEWVVGEIDGAPKIFCASVDEDGTNRVWEGFRPARLDNGVPITWTFETRAYTSGQLAPKQFRYADLYLSELSDVVDLKVGWAGSARGRFKEVMTKRIRALRGSIGNRSVRFDQNEFALKKQTRLTRTTDQKGSSPDEFTSCGVESDREEWIDTGFRLCVMVNGPGSVRAVKMFFGPEVEKPAGKCEEDEENERASRFDGADAAGDVEEVLDILQEIDAVFTGNDSVSLSSGDVSVVGSGTAESKISQACADKLATAVATMRAQKQLEESAVPFLGGFNAN